jgi:tetratricopeptide (TPR) repeat protein
MKKTIVILLLFFSTISYAQLNLPELSPVGNIHQQVGYTTFDIRYGRPAARQRKIMGDLVPYKKLWRTGAGEGTTISFDQEVIIDDKRIPPGIYAFITIPDEREWTVLLNTDTSKIYGDPSEYDAKTEVVSFKVTPQKTNRFYESLTFDLDIVKYDAVFYLAWENTQIHFPIATRSHQKAIAEIDKVLNKNPNDQEALATASYYYFMNNEDAGQILQWLNKALGLGEERWIYYQKVDVLERMKDYGEARKTANTAIAFLSRTKPEGWEYSVREYEKRIKQWPGN